MLRVATLFSNIFNLFPSAQRGTNFHKQYIYFNFYVLLIQQRFSICIASDGVMIDEIVVMHMEETGVGLT
jgi:hypothetical protein